MTNETPKKTAICRRHFMAAASGVALATGISGFPASCGPRHRRSSSA